MGRKHRPKISKIVIPPREIDFIKDGIPSGHCLLCEEWIGVNGHEHHHHKPPTAETTKDAQPTKVFPKMAETPHIIVSPDADVDEEPEFPVIDGEEEEANSLPQSPIEKEDHVQDSPEATPPVQGEEVNTPSHPEDSPPPLYESSPSPSESPVNQTPPLVEHQTGATPLKDDLERRQSLGNERVLRKETDPLRRSVSEVQISNEDISPPIDVFDISPIEKQLEQGRSEPIRPGQFHSHSMGHSFGGSLGHSLKNDNSNLDPMELLQRKTRRHSMIDMMRRASSQSNISAAPIVHQPAGIRSSISKTSLVTSASGFDSQREGVESMILCVSALYGKLLVVMGMAFPIAEILSNDVPLIFYNTFYLYLYFGSILFLIYAYLFLLRAKSLPSVHLREKLRSIKKSISTSDVRWTEVPMPETVRRLLPRKSAPEESRSDKLDGISMSTIHKAPKYTITESSNHGSMYLKMGAVLFGVGSMIYSGLEFGQYFELRRDSECGNVLMAITPVARMLFTFLQMYFIFLNSRVAISKHTIIARFGLMHMIGTNLCIWLNVLVQETEHEIHHLTHSDIHKGQPSNLSHYGLESEIYPRENHSAVLDTGHHHKRSLDMDDLHGHPTPTTLGHELTKHVEEHQSDVDHFFNCRKINIMGNVVNSASPFLFPCTIEYSLLCAGVLYVMWKNINVTKTEKNMADADSEISNFIARKVRHHYSVDCARASRGLFMGIFVLVLTIISLILFYVLISNQEFQELAILEANIVELSIYSLSLVSVILGMKQMRELEFYPEGDIELDNILLLIAQAGVYIYTSFTIIGDYFSLEVAGTETGFSYHNSPILSLSTAIITLIQTTIQTLFILDGSRRCCYTTDQHDRKPGREVVTFLLVCNLALWAISTFETSRADVHPTQLEFYGIWAWTIISHVSMPLAIFYRFHVTVCLGEIWKRSYKMKQDVVGMGVDTFR